MGSSKTRGGKPRLESDVSTEATAGASADGDDAVTSAVDAVNTILLTPPSARGKPDADVTAAINTVAMPPPPPRVPAATLGARVLPADSDGVARVHVKESESAITVVSPRYARVRTCARSV